MKKNLLLLLVAFLATSAASAATAPLAKLQDGVLTFYVGDDSETSSENVYKLDYDCARGWAPGGSGRGLSRDECLTIAYVVFDPSFAQARPTSTMSLFEQMSKLASITGIEYLNTSEVTDMAGMFDACSALTSIDLSHFDTGKVTDMNSMFSGCSALTSLDASYLNTSNVTDMSGMFRNCNNLTSLNINGFDTKNVTDMSDMFGGCEKLTSINVKHFDTGNVTLMSNMFYGCSALTDLDLTGFNTANVSYMRNMFNGCTSLTGIDLSHFDTGNVTTMSGMFSACINLASLDISNFTTSQVEDASSLCDGCNKLTELNIGKNDFSHIADDPSWPTTYFHEVGTAAAPCKLIVNRTGDDGFNISVLGEVQQNEAGQQYYQWSGGYFALEAGTPTGITQVDAGDKQLDASAPAYNLQGQRVGDSYRGVVIQNGRKLIRK